MNCSLDGPGRSRLEAPSYLFDLHRFHNIASGNLGSKIKRVTLMIYFFIRFFREQSFRRHIAAIF